jgi:hypothetical protein
MRMVLGSLVTRVMQQIERSTVAEETKTSILEDFPIVFLVRRRNDITENLECVLHGTHPVRRFRNFNFFHTTMSA